MRVVELQRYGGPEELHVVERPEPAPSGEEVAVRVAAVAVNPVDVATRAGLFTDATPGAALPVVLGWDFAGTVEGTTEEVAGFVPWVAEGTGRGSSTEVLLADPSWFAPLPPGTDPVAASTVPLNAVTAAQALDLLALRPGDSLLVTGASGGVGGFAVQIAAAAGLTVVATASGGDEAYVAGLGPKEVLGRHAALPRGVDGVLDAAGAPGAIGAVRDGGAFVAVTDPGTPTPERGVRVDTVHVTPDRARLATLLQDFADGRLSTRVAGTLPFADAAEAHRRLAAGGLRGKLVLVP